MESRSWRFEIGVAIMMTPGPDGRNFGKQTNITPGLRSRAAAIIRDRFGYLTARFE